MMLLPCPWCGPRNATEFRYVGEDGARPDPNAATPAQWRRHLYMQRNPLGWVREGWYHRAGCRQFFSVERDTGTNRVRTAGADV
ncbi:MAG: sarcosine oxidase subunit delta [Pseudonocardia sp.]|nr:sarcosine oxidase subunit delta [Pseudonocardia sp.]